MWWTVHCFCAQFELRHKRRNSSPFLIFHLCLFPPGTTLQFCLMKCVVASNATRLCLVPKIHQETNPCLSFNFRTAAHSLTHARLFLCVWHLPRLCVVCARMFIRPLLFPCMLLACFRGRICPCVPKLTGSQTSVLKG